MNTYVIILFLCFIFDKFAKVSNKLVSLCHYWVVSVDFFEAKDEFNVFGIKAVTYCTIKSEAL